MRLKYTNKIEIFENIAKKKGHYHLIFVKHEKQTQS
jgi:hypothetical protein